MNYAIPNQSTVVTSKKIVTKKVLSSETRKRKAFFASHRVSINIDPITKEPKVEVTVRK